MLTRDSTLLGSKLSTRKYQKESSNFFKSKISDFKISAEADKISSWLRTPCTHAQVSSPSKAFFLSRSKTGRSDHPTSKPAFLVDFSCVLQPKNSVLGLMGLQEMRISSFGKWA